MRLLTGAGAAEPEAPEAEAAGHIHCELQRLRDRRWSGTSKRSRTASLTAGNQLISSDGFTASPAGVNSAGVRPQSD